MFDSSSPLLLIRPDFEHAAYHEMLCSPDRMDKVHPLTRGREKEELVSKRLGYANSNKRCFAYSPNGEIQSVIYTMALDVPEEDESWKMLPGKIEPILQADSARLQDVPNVIVFYSISSFVQGTGKDLIKSLYGEFTQAAETPILTTLSPLRTLNGWLAGRDFQNLDEEDKIQIVVAHLKTRTDPVQKFHLGNGAQVGAIHLDASEYTKDATDGAGVMISYRYPRRMTRLDENLSILRGGRIPASYHLAPLFK